MKLHFSRGLSIPSGAKPVAMVSEMSRPVQAAILASDFPSIRWQAQIPEGQVVARGEALVRDRKCPDIVLTSPISGRVSEIAIGARRRLQWVTIEPEGDERLDFGPVDGASPEGLRALMLRAGLWPALRTRPFDRIPDPAAEASAVFVTAVDTNPNAADPLLILAGREDEFSRGVRAMELLTQGPVYVCQPAGARLFEPSGRIVAVDVSGPHPAGLPGSHIARLHPATIEKPVWHINYQDVIALGGLLATGEMETFRVIAASGPGMRNPRYLRVPLGVDLHALLRNELTPGQKIILSGSALSGWESRFLCRHHLQASVLEAPRPKRSHWFLAALARAAKPAAFIPTQALEQALGPDLPVVPLLRSLSVGNIEAAEKLGGLGLSEEDMALATYVTGAEIDFGKKLRAVLNELEEGA
ncbi:Na(+)-translocating NADH-quinone reductase subunit A [Pelagibacterium limicola]|uniref:Na(+)-translocating NADH-quinone reductase subunit A n=1 Tax=Pelagibacterium limicola TaxID=2791022 RepID=UPI0018AF75DC|nr:Na(+)-translocating NADH-quinone reductase subunit A [Pelagibacterium limicola]